MRAGERCRSGAKKHRSAAGRLAVVCLLALLMGGCGQAQTADEAESAMQEWLQKAELADRYTKDELYEAALTEGTLVVYSVSSRTFRAKEAFEREYPGLCVEIKDIRSNDVVNMLKADYEAQRFACDVVICSDCDGSLYQELIAPGIIHTYVPWDIAPKLRKGAAEPELDFLGEAMLLFYNTDVFEQPPVGNIWELTEERYRGRIMMASPLSSFSTYGFCAQTMCEEEALAQAYEAYAGRPLDVPEGRTAGMVFWEMLGENLVFVNSNDEVLEGVGNSSDIWFGFMISSKARYQSLGYHIAYAREMEPFCGVYTPNCISLAGGSENINAAKLFIRYILGETDGGTEGAAAFATEGAWSVRTDMPDGNTAARDELALVSMDKQYLYQNRELIFEFFSRLLEEKINLE